VVGHNPGITDLTYDLTSGGTSFLPTTGLAVIEYDSDNWSGISSKKPADYYFMKPKDPN
jgi:phosphohistidine phosphatase SixA